MYTAFQESERFHVLGFFDFCSARPATKVGDLLRYLRSHDWLNFAKFYGGRAKRDYMTRLRASFDIASTVLMRKVS